MGQGSVANFGNTAGTGTVGADRFIGPVTGDVTGNVSGSTGAYSGAVTVGGNLTTNGYIYESAATGITAGTTRNQGGATALTKEINRIDTATAPSAGSYLGDGVLLPLAAAGLDIMVWNNTAYPVQVYGNTSDTINGVAAGTGIPIPPSSIYIFVAASTSSWIVDGTGMGNSGGYATETTLDGITAHSGGGQGSATALPAMINRVTTVAAGNDSVVLPATAVGLSITVINAAASNALAVFPPSGSYINALSINAAFSVAAGKTATFYACNSTQWHSILSA